jgi:hypothetical protein
VFTLAASQFLECPTRWSPSVTTSICTRLRSAGAAVTTFLLLALVPLVVPPLPADAASPPVSGYAFGNNPTSAHYVPSPQFNSYSPYPPSTAGRNSMGVYTVTFPGMAVAGGLRMRPLSVLARSTAM